MVIDAQLFGRCYVPFDGFTWVRVRFHISVLGERNTCRFSLPDRVCSCSAE